MKRGITKWLALAGVAAGVAAGLAPAASAQNPPTNVSQSAEEKRACIKNLKTIFEAIDAFQNEQHDLPNWLSDLVPKYLEDPNVLVCPVCRRTGQTEAAPLADPKLPSSYLFEFCPVPLGQSATNAPARTRREWKRRQMGLVGSQVPIVRCRFHKPVLNVAFDGRIYESPTSWELLFTNRVKLNDLTPARMFADVRPPVAGAKKKAAASPRFPARSAKARREMVDLTPFYNVSLDPSAAGNKGYDLAALPKGVQSFGGVEFDVRGIIQLGSKSPATVGYPAAVRAIPVNQTCQRLHFLHAAAFGDDAEEGKLIGTYVVHYTGAQSPLKLTIHYGQEVWDCHSPLKEADAPADLTVAWTGKSAAGKNLDKTARLFLSTWTNPAPAREIECIDFVSGVATAAPFLVAITLE